ncbi:hypothetical protein ACFQUU_26020 [Herbaspirillum sp. GCM10030257]|uniref:hypothetical protein n=1 Tax=Herbaspirillum sp. GCM10030257 TaxID=3273393 RepID=UPI00361514B4
MIKIPSTVGAADAMMAQLPDEATDFSLDATSMLSLPRFPIEEIARAQCLNSWISKVPISLGTVSYDGPGEARDVLRMLGTSPLGLMLVARRREWFPPEDFKRLKTIRADYFEQLHSWPDLARRDSTFILCDDAYSKGLPSPLYDSAGSLRSDTYFEKFVPTLVESVMQAESLRGEINTQSSLLTTLLYELVKNTHDHALYTAEGEGIEDSVRLVLSRYYKLDDLDIPVPAKNAKEPLEPHIAFVKALKQKSNDSMRDKNKKTFRGILEFSVLDSGPGFVGSWLKRKIASDEDISVEYKAVLDCLRAGHSTARNPNRGLGLSDVLRALRALDGFIRIRTNRISVYRDFMLLRDDKREPVEEHLHDWKRGVSSKASIFGNMTGAAVSVLVPVEA